MFHSFLQKRKEKDKVEVMASVLEKLMGSSNKLEALVESLHKKEVGEQETKNLIVIQDKYERAFNFYKALHSMVFSLSSYYENNSEGQKELVVSTMLFFSEVEYEGELIDFLNKNLEWNVVEFHEVGKVYMESIQSFYESSAESWYEMKRLYASLDFDVKEISKYRPCEDVLRAFGYRLEA